MAKKKENKEIVEENGIKRIEYLSLIEGLSDEAFGYYTDNVIKDLIFKVLKRKDIRKIDVEEKVVYRIEYLYYRSLKIGADESVERYASFLKQFLDGYIDCEENSRAEAYFYRAMGLADKLIDHVGTLDDLHDLVLLFIGLFKSYKDADMTEISSIDLSINNDVSTLVRWISEGKDLESPAKGRFKVAKNPAKNLTDFDQEFLFITTLLFACVLMQENGVFEEN